MSEREKLLKKLESIKALAEKGVGGEKENAEALLQTLMNKYGVTEADLEDAGARKYWIRFKAGYEERLIFQLAYKHLGDGHAFNSIGYSGRRRKEVCVECTPAQYIEIEADHQFYWQALEAEMKIFYRAFLEKNNLFPPPELVRKDENSKKYDAGEIEKIRKMKTGIDRYTRHKALEN